MESAPSNAKLIELHKSEIPYYVNKICFVCRNAYRTIYSLVASLGEFD